MGSFIEIKNDLFKISNNYALAHCVGNDFLMSAGIAVEFRKRFANQQWLINNSRGIGTALLLSPPLIEDNVFYLISKRYSKTSKPSYQDIENCLIDMFQQATNKKFKGIVMPRIGCGLDGKDWNIVKELIKKHQNDINVLVCYL